MKYIVYCTTCIVSKKIYVGVHRTIDPSIFDGYIGCGIYVNRPCSYENAKTRFQFAVKKYGPKNFVRNIIKIFDNEEDAYSLESEIVNADFLKRPDVYNMILGGIDGLMKTNAIKIYLYSDSGKFIAEYESIRFAALEIGRDFATVYRAVKEKCKCKGFFWTTTKFEKLDLSKMKSYEGHHKMPVFQYSEDGEYDCCYESIKDASRVLGIHDANIGLAIKLGTICYNKYFTDVYAPNFSIAKTKEITSREIYLYGLDGKYISSYHNMQEAKNKLGITSNIYNAIKLGRTCGNYQWSFEKLESISPVKPKSGKARKIGKYDKDWNLICTYKTLSECKKENGSGMVHVLQGRDQFAKGYRYKYLDN